MDMAGLRKSARALGRDLIVIHAGPDGSFSVPELGQEEPGLVPVAIVWHASEQVRAERLKKALERA